MSYTNTESARADLLTALSAAKEPAAQWISFMELVHSLAPEVFSVGRPSKKDIERSFIGEAGFKSWREMIETPVDQGGLGWSWSTWVQWSRAWRTLEDQPVLNRAALTPAQVNRLAERVRKGDAEWPERPEDAKSLLRPPVSPEAPKTATGDAVALAEAQARVAELERALEAMKKSPLRRLLSWVTSFFR